MRGLTPYSEGNGGPKGGTPSRHRLPGITGGPSVPFSMVTPGEIQNYFGLKSVVLHFQPLVSANCFTTLRIAPKS